MIREIIAWLLGPSGIAIVEWYGEHGLICNGTLVLIAILAALYPKRSEKIRSALSEWWKKTPLAVPDEERKSYEEAKARHLERKSQKKMKKKEKGKK